MKVKKVILFCLGFFLLLTLCFLKKTKAYTYNLINPQIILSDSSPNATSVEYLFQFTTQFSLAEGDQITIDFPEAYQSPPASSSDVFCPENLNPFVEGRRIICQVASGKSLPPTTTQIVVSNVTNPPKQSPPGVADVYFFLIKTSADEGAFLPVSILEKAKVKGRVFPILSFEVRGVGGGEKVHESWITTVSTTASSIAFENLPTNTPVLAAQDVFVTTNAGFGFLLQIIQQDYLKAQTPRGTFRIFCFSNGNCKSLENAISWEKPLGILADPKTYGHLGITSEDNSVGENCAFNYYGFGQGGKWAGVDPNVPLEVMRNCGPADGTTRHQGWTRVGFQVEVTPLQPAGNYQTSFTYVLTPIF